MIGGVSPNARRAAAITSSELFIPPPPTRVFLEFWMDGAFAGPPLPMISPSDNTNKHPLSPPLSSRVNMLRDASTETVNGVFTSQYELRVRVDDCGDCWFAVNERNA